MRLGTYPLPSPKMSVTGVHNFCLSHATLPSHFSPTSGT